MGDEPAAEGGTGGLREGPRDLHLGVALHQLIAIDERWQVRHVGDIEEHRQRARHESDDIQLPDRQHIEGVRDRDGSEHQGSSDVAGDQDRPSPKAVDPRPGRQAEEDERSFYVFIR